MKTILLSSLLIVLNILSATAQWTIDPNNPTAVCNATGLQSGVQSIADGEGGIFIFWYDSRTGSNQWDIYGQHYDTDGQALWETNGREIVNYDGRVSAFSFVRNDSDGSFLFALAINYSTNTADNGVYVRKIDENGESIWEEDVKVMDATSYPNSLGSVRIVKSLEFYYISVQGTNIGGSGSLRINKIDGDGNLLWPYNGSTPTGMTGFGSYAISSDNNGGVYFYHTSCNCLGASVRCMLVAGENSLQNQWAAWNVVTSGSQGLDGGYSGIGDADGITFIWVGNGSEGTGNNIYSRRVLASNGLLGWNAATKLICAANGSQNKPYWKKSGNNYYITWSDGRPGVVGNAAIYAQKFTINGVILWEENGVEVANLNTYIPYSEFDLDENNTMCVTHKAGTGFVAHKVDNNGAVTWGPGGVITMSNNNAPFYEDYNVVYTGGKFLVAVSRSVPSGGADNIYVNKIHPAPVQLSQSVTACNTYTTYGETYNLSGVYTINYDPDTILTLNLTIINNVSQIDVDGTMLIAVNDGGFQWYNCDTNEPIEGADGSVFTVTASGSYALQLTNGQCTSMSECVNISLSPVEVEETVESCNSYTTNGETFDESGTYNIALDPDTVLILHLTIIENDAEVTVSGNILTAVNSGDYQWYNCDTNQPIEGATNATFTATEAGSYALQLTNGECVDMSECVEITIISVEDNFTNDVFSIYPNPGNEFLVIQSKETPGKPTEIRVVDMQGKIAHNQTFNNGDRWELKTSELTSGIYCVQILSGDSILNKVWIKN